MFKTFSAGLKTNRDTWVYNFSIEELDNNVSSMIKEFNEHVSLVNNNDITSNNLQDTVNNDPTKISWSGDLKKKLLKGEYYNQEYGNTLISTYRPFVKEWVYFSNLFNNSIYLLPILFPEPNIDNLVITIQAPGGTKDFSVLMVDNIPDLHLVGDTQAFPFYIYKTDKGSLFKEENLDNGSYITAPSGEHYICQKNVTDWALNEYRKRYGLDVTKEDIFYYVYGLLHSPDYRERYKHNLKRTLPHIPFVTSTEDFRSFSDAGRRLAELHLYYENLPLFDQINKRRP
nr:type ISP restriction/modification enzyme [Natranaerobius thermophilus]